ncbi:MAG: hypothetical protein ACR2MD_11045 [Aridibacter sp.]
MNIFAGKTPTERNKIIAAMVLGVMAVIALTYTFGGMLLGSRKGTTTITVTASPSPTATVSGQLNPDPNFPTQDEILSEYLTFPIVYNPDSFYAPPPGRNIFAFYEPPLPTPVPPFVPGEKTPTPTTPFPTPTPTPVPPLLLSYVNPQSVYAGTNKSFRLDVRGEKFTPESQIFFNAIPLPTTYVSPQSLYAIVPASYISNAGQARILVATPDGKLYSNEGFFNIQAPPKPQLTYIGLIARRHNNNDTAFFQETGKQDPTEARLNDIVAGRFRVMSISVEEVELIDTQLGFRYKLKLERTKPGSVSYPNIPDNDSEPPPEPDDSGADNQE